VTDVTRGASLPVAESFFVFGDGYRDDVGIAAVPVATSDIDLECYQVIVQNDPGNANNMYVGNQHNQSVVLQPGQSETIPFRGKVSDVYVRFAAGSSQRVNWHAMR
jgi:hypothetical protein